MNYQQWIFPCQAAHGTVSAPARNAAIRLCQAYLLDPERPVGIQELQVARSGPIRVHEGFERDWPGSRSLATEIVLNVVRTGMTLNARVDAIVREHGLPSATSLGVLEVLRAEGAPLQPSAIAQRLLSSRPALSGVLDTLQRRGFLQRQAHPDTGRGRLVEITPSGIDVLDRVLPLLHRAEASWMTSLSERQQQQLITSLGKLQADLDPANDGRIWPYR
jgi:DNA-binding MarR family transcriptional regulator